MRPAAAIYPGREGSSRGRILTAQAFVLPEVARSRLQRHAQEDVAGRPPVAVLALLALLTRFVHSAPQDKELVRTEQEPAIGGEVHAGPRQQLLHPGPVDQILMLVMGGVTEQAESCARGVHP